MEYTSKKQSEILKEAGVDVMTSDVYVSEDGKVVTDFSDYICPRCHGQLIWKSDFTRSKIEGEDSIDVDDDALVTYYTCKDCNCTIKVVDAWPNEEGEGAHFRIAWTTDALIKLITDRGFDFIMIRTTDKNKKKAKFMIDVFYQKEDGSGGVFKKFGDTIIDVLAKSVVEIYMKKYKKY